MNNPEEFTKDKIQDTHFSIILESLTGEMFLDLFEFSQCLMALFMHLFKPMDKAPKSS